MAKAPGRKLKVFQAQFGFHDSVVAAPSQSAALRVWGIRQNLFAEGQAHVTNDPQAVAAARAHPEVPLRRAIGSKDPFEFAPTALPKVPDAPRRKMAKTARVPTPAPKMVPADRSELDAAEAGLRALDERRRREEARLRGEQEALDREMAAHQEAYVEKHKAAKAALVEARRAYRKAGGED